MMSSRREFLKLGAGGLACAATGVSAEPVLGMIFPPANYPVPPEAHLMYPSGIKFLAAGLGLPSMTPAGYDSVIDKIVPEARKLATHGASAVSIMGASLTFYKGAAFNEKLTADVHKATRLQFLQAVLGQLLVSLPWAVVVSGHGGFTPPSSNLLARVQRISGLSCARIRRGILSRSPT